MFYMANSYKLFTTAFFNSHDIRSVQETGLPFRITYSGYFACVMLNCPFLNDLKCSITTSLGGINYRA